MLDTSKHRNLGPLDRIPPREINTARLLLRAIKESDAEEIYKAYAHDPDTCRYMSFKAGIFPDTAKFAVEAAKRFRGELSTTDHFAWVICPKGTSTIIGSTGYEPSGPFTLVGGYVLAKRYWGQGFASEAWSAVLAWAKLQPRVFRIEAQHSVENPSSGKVMLKAGMVFEGIAKRSSIYPNLSDLPQDSAIYAWTRS